MRGYRGAGSHGHQGALEHDCRGTCYLGQHGYHRLGKKDQHTSVEKKGRMEKKMEKRKEKRK
jgi:hypothetical protein